MTESLKNSQDDICAGEKNTMILQTYAVKIDFSRAQLGGIWNAAFPQLGPTIQKYKHVV